jgi:hypothetical protein
VLVDAAAASTMLPDGFVVLEPVPGRAVLALVTQDCVTAIDDGLASPAVNSVVFVFLDPGRSPAGCQTYDFFWTNSRNDDWHRAMQRIGVAEELSPRTTLTIEASLFGVSAHATNPFARAPFAYGGPAVDAAPPPGPLTSVHCHLGRSGLVRQTYDHQIRAGGGVVDVKLGRSSLWTQLGAADTTAPALLARFTWTGLTEIVAL